MYTWRREEQRRGEEERRRGGEEERRTEGEWMASEEEHLFPRFPPIALKGGHKVFKHFGLHRDRRWSRTRRRVTGARTAPWRRDRRAARARRRGRECVSSDKLTASCSSARFLASCSSLCFWNLDFVCGGVDRRARASYFACAL
jgi:hypothetical protein